MSVDAATKNEVRTATDVLRWEAGSGTRVTAISPGTITTNVGDSIADQRLKEAMGNYVGDFALSPLAIACGILFALEQAPEVDVDSIDIRQTA